MNSDAKAPVHVQEQLQSWFPPGVLACLRTAGEVASEMGYSLYLIGGGVRDMLLERPFDWDVDLVSETYGVEKLAQALQQRWGGQLQSFAQYGTAKLRLPEESYGPLELDFATARTELYAHPGANPDVSFSTLDADLIRRDFSINAMAVGLLPHQFGALIDPFGGWADLQARSLRALHDQKFIEDPVRCWRAARMSQMLGFGIEPDTEHRVREVMAAGTFDGFFTARMLRELHKILDKPDPLPYLQGLQDLGVLRCLDPGLDGARLQAFAAAVPETLTLLAEADRRSVYLLGLSSMLSPQAQHGLELSRQLLQAASTLAQVLAQPADWQELAPSAAHARLKALPAEALAAALALNPAPALRQAILSHCSVWRYVRPLVSGTIIKEWIPPGPHIRRILDALLKARLDGLIDTHEEELALAQQLAAELQPDQPS